MVFYFLAAAAALLPLVMWAVELCSPLHIGAREIWLTCSDDLLVYVRNAGDIQTHDFTAMPLLLVCAGIPIAGVTWRIRPWKWHTARAYSLTIFLGLTAAWPALVIFTRGTEDIGVRLAAAFFIFVFLSGIGVAVMFVIEIGSKIGGYPESRRRSRIRRGLCVNCEYDLTGNQSGICPECGRNVEPNWIELLEATSDAPDITKKEQPYHGDDHTNAPPL